MIIYDADDPLVLNGTYDREGYKPGERARIAKARARREKDAQDSALNGNPSARKDTPGRARRRCRRRRGIVVDSDARGVRQLRDHPD